MSITTKERPTNIKDLVIAEPRSLWPNMPDPKELLGPAHWAEVRQEVDRTINYYKKTVSIDSESFLQTAYFLDPRLIRPYLGSELLSKLRRELTDTSVPLSTVIEYAAAMKIIDSERTEQKYLFTPVQEKGIQKIFTRGNPFAKILAAASLKILGDRYQDLGQLPEDAWEKEKERLQKNFLAADYTDVRHLTWMRLADSDRFQDEFFKDKENTEVFWANAAQTITDYTNEGFIKMAIRTAARLRILAAREVKINDQGVELIMSNQDTFSSDSQPLPQVRKF